MTFIVQIWKVVLGLTLQHVKQHHLDNSVNTMWMHSVVFHIPKMPEHRDVEFTLMCDKQKNQILTIKKVEPVHLRSFAWRMKNESNQLPSTALWKSHIQNVSQLQQLFVAFWHLFFQII